MSNCNHVFIGRSDGVHCTKCGWHLSGREYAEYCLLEEEKDPYLKEFEELPSETVFEKTKKSTVKRSANVIAKAL